MEARSFGYWLRIKRKALDLTREALAERVGCSKATIQKLEEEERRPSAQITERLAEIFNIPQNERISFLRFARGNLQSAPPETPENFPWHVSTQSPRSNLPTSLTSLIGRDKDITDVHEYLLRVDIHLVTLIGPPGIGKTRLSIESARKSLHDFPDGIFFVALAPFDDPSLIAPAVIQALGYAEIKTAPTRQQLIKGIGEKRMLLILDNCEHLIESVALFASDILLSCSHLKILATSRESLRVAGEWLYSVSSLGIPREDIPVDLETYWKFPALLLFAERAQAARSDFALNANNIQAVANICAQLDGLPLAIELIAARVRLMSPESLLPRLNDQFTLSADGMRAMSTRQKTLSNAIAWSYNLLPLEEQKMFAYLSVFSGGFTLEAADSIFSGMITARLVPNLITSLLDKSLLQRAFDHEAQDEPRFSMLVTIQQFALNCVRRLNNEETELHNRHLMYFLDFAEQADKEIHGPNQIEWLNRVATEHGNFRAALEWCLSSQKTEAALRLLGALGLSWLVRGHYSEARIWFEQIHALPEITAHPALNARLLNFMGRLNWHLGDFREAQSVLNESQAICLKLGADGELGLAYALDFLGMVAYSNEGDLTTAQSFFERSLELYQKHGDQWGNAFISFHLSMIAVDRDDDATALLLLEQSIDFFHQLGDVWGIGRVSQLLGKLFLKQKNYEKAHFFLNQHLRIDESLHFKQGTTMALLNLGELYRYQGDYVQAKQFYEKGLAMCREYSLKDDWELALYSLGMIALHQSDYPLVRRHFMNYFDSAWPMNGRISACDLLIGLASVAAGMNQPERAAKLHGAAQEIFETTDYQISPFDRAEFDRHIQMARDQLGERGFETLQSEGRGMTLEQAIAYALEKSNG